MKFYAASYDAQNHRANIDSGRVMQISWTTIVSTANPPCAIKLCDAEVQFQTPLYYFEIEKSVFDVLKLSSQTLLTFVLNCSIVGRYELHLPALQQFVVSEVETFNIAVFSQVKHVKQLIVERLNICSLDLEDFQNLRHLTVKNCNMTSITGLDALQDLKRLNVRYNCLTNLVLFNQKLETIDASFNRFQYIDLVGCPISRTLIVHGNKLKFKVRCSDYQLQIISDQENYADLPDASQALSLLLKNYAIYSAAKSVTDELVIRLNAVHTDLQRMLQ